MQRMRIRNPTDFWTGLLFGGFGLFAALYAATHYNLGTAVRMGPGYFPTWVGGLVALLGLALALRSLKLDGPALPRVRLRQPPGPGHVARQIQKLCRIEVVDHDR